MADRTNKRERIREVTPEPVTKNYGEVLSPSDAFKRINVLCEWIKKKAALAEERYWTIAQAEWEEFGEVSATPLAMADEICASAADDADQIMRQFSFLCGQTMPDLTVASERIWYNSKLSLHTEAAVRVCDHLVMLAETVRDLTNNPNYEAHQLRKNIGIASPWAVTVRTLTNISSDEIPNALTQIYNSAAQFLSEGIGPYFPTVYTCGLDCMDAGGTPDNYSVVGDMVYGANGTTALDYPSGSSVWHEANAGDTMYIARLDSDYHASLVGTKFIMPSSSVISIANQTDLYKIGNSSYPAFPADGNYELTANISLTGTQTPLPDFSGTFNGGGYTISNLDVDDRVAVGLFGKILHGSIVYDLNVSGDAEGVKDVGILCGANSGTITDCSVSGTVTASSTAHVYRYGLGGAVGYNYGTIRYSSASVDISGGGIIKEFYGGLVGKNYGTIEYCHASGDVVGQEYVGGLTGLSSKNIQLCYATGNVDGLKHVGGLIGYASGDTKYCYAEGNVDAPRYTGGLIGWNVGNIQNCYASGDADGSGDVCVGGLVGRNDGQVSKSFSYGVVTGGTSWDSGFIGYNHTGGYCSDSYYDQTTSGYTDDDGRGTPETTANMQTQSTYSGWDFTDIWNTPVPATSYPSFQSILDVGGGIGSDSFTSYGEDNYDFGTGFIVRKLKGA